MNKFLVLRITCIAISLATFLNNSITAISDINYIKLQLKPDEYDNADYTLDNFAISFRNKCQELVGEEGSSRYRDVIKALLSFSECYGANYRDYDEKLLSTIPAEFKSYCIETLGNQMCIFDMSKYLQPCLTEDEKLQNQIAMNVVVHIFNYMCLQGSVISDVFLDEKKPECIVKNEKTIESCTQKSMDSNVTFSVTLQEMKNIMDLSNRCLQYEVFQQCFSSQLHDCRKQLPSNTIENIFQITRAQLKCALKQLATEPNNQNYSLKSGSSMTEYNISVLVIILLGWLFVFVLGKCSLRN